MNVNECAGNKPCVDGIEIITLATGTTRTWLGSSVSGDILNPVWTDNGTAVMFEWGSGRLPGNGYWILSDAAPLGNLLAESVRVPYPPAQPNPPTAILTPDGRTLLIMTQRIVPTSGSSGNWVFRITDVDPGTGRLLRVLATFEQPYKGNPYAADAQCNILSLAPTGLHALVACPRFGRLDGSTFTPLPAVVPPDVALASAISVAW